MNTQHLTSSPDDLQYAAKLLQSGQIVGMPTETVYGLAADALNPEPNKETVLPTLYREKEKYKYK